VARFSTTTALPLNQGPSNACKKNRELKQINNKDEGKR